MPRRQPHTLQSWSAARAALRHLSVTAVALLPVGWVEVGEDSYENGSSVMGALGGMKIEQFTEATPGHTVTEGLSARQLGDLPADSYSESTCDHDASDTCLQSASEFVFRLVRTHVH